MACIWWWVIVQEGSPIKYGMDPDNGYYEAHNGEILKEEYDHKTIVKLIPGINTMFGHTKYFL